MSIIIAVNDGDVCDSNKWNDLYDSVSTPADAAIILIMELHGIDIDRIIKDEDAHLIMDALRSFFNVFRRPKVAAKNSAEFCCSKLKRDVHLDIFKKITGLDLSHGMSPLYGCFKKLVSFNAVINDLRRLKNKADERAAKMKSEEKAYLEIDLGKVKPQFGYVALWLAAYAECVLMRNPPDWDVVMFSEWDDMFNYQLASELNLSVHGTKFLVKPCYMPDKAD